MKGHVVSIVSPKDVHYHKEICNGLGISSFHTYPLQAASRSIQTKKYTNKAIATATATANESADNINTSSTNSNTFTANEITNEILNLNIFPYNSELLSEGIKLAKTIFKITSQKAMDQKSAVWEKNIAEECELMPDDVYGDLEVQDDEDDEEGSNSRGKSSDREEEKQRAQKDVRVQRERLQYLIKHRFQLERSMNVNSIGGGSGGVCAAAVLGLGGNGGIDGGHVKGIKPRIKRGLVMKVTKQSLIKQQIIANRSWKKDKCVVYRG